jgi:hypothetical protein
MNIQTGLSKEMRAFVSIVVCPEIFLTTTHSEALGRSLVDGWTHVEMMQTCTVSFSMT